MNQEVAEVFKAWEEEATLTHGRLIGQFEAFGDLRAITDKTWEPAFVLALSAVRLIEIDRDTLLGIIQVKKRLTNIQNLRQGGLYQQIVLILGATITGFETLTHSS